MGRKEKKLAEEEAIKRVFGVGLNKLQSSNNNIANNNTTNDGSICSIEERVKEILNIINTKKGNNYMLFFVMYDIESNKVRRYIVKYLQKQGCIRIQKSIFLANIEIEKFNEIKEDLHTVQSLYENNDSIIIVPITAEYLKSMKIIGKNINLDIITQSKNTLFF